MADSPLNMTVPRRIPTDSEPQIKTTEYLVFRLAKLNPKTAVYMVLSRRHGTQLGVIKWHSPWRQYAFFPASDTLFNTGCMNDISEFIGVLMEGRK